MDTSTIVSITISAISVACAIYFSSKSSRATDTKEIERRVAERTETNIKLDNISKNTDDIKQNVTSVQRDLQKHAEKNSRSWVLCETSSSSDWYFGK